MGNRFDNPLAKIGLLDQYLNLLHQYKEGKISKEEAATWLNRLEKDKLLELKILSNEFSNTLSGLITETLSVKHQVKVNISKKMYSCTEIAEKLGISRQIVNQWKFEGIVYRGIKKMIPEDAVIEYIKGSKYEKVWFENC